MPRFFFNVYDGVHLSRDEEGNDLPDVATAGVEAVRLAGSIIKDDALSVSVGPEWRLEVTDAVGLILFRLDFLITRSAATSAAEWRPPSRKTESLETLADQSKHLIAESRALMARSKALHHRGSVAAA